MNSRCWNRNIERLLALAILLVCLALLQGCASCGRNTVLLESEQRWYIPAGTEFHAQSTVGGPLLPFTRQTGSWVVSAADLAELEETANACTMKSLK
jgi:ABC-type bacteriocin/lantibiotic exporter with double-glycine peptidase domain